MEEFYSLQVFGVVLRLLAWYVLLFGVLGPYILPGIPRTSLAYRLMYSWIGAGGFILVSTVLLVQIYLYDFISIAILLFVLPFSIYVKTYRNQGYSYGEAFSFIYHQLLLKQIRFIEKFKWKEFIKKIKDKTRYFQRVRHQDTISLLESFLVPVVALVGAFIRFYPAFSNASPFTRSWYDSLHRVKELSLQQYFDVSVDPGGMHVLVNFFSKLTQVSPELILHLLGGLTSMLISVWIYGMLRGMIHERRTIAPLAGMSLYALAPIVIMPISLETQVVPNTIDLGLSFALPVVMVWMRNLRRGRNLFGMFVAGGIVAAGLINLFVLLLILLPGLVILGLTVPGNVPYYRQVLDIGKVLLLAAAVLSVYGLVTYLSAGVDMNTYLLEQLYSTEFYSYFPNLWLPLEQMAFIYGIIGVFTVLLTVINNLVGRRKDIFQYHFYGIFILVSLLYLPELELGYTYVDLDQLSAFYAVLIAVLGGLLFYNFISLLTFVFKQRPTLQPYVEIVCAIAGIGYILFLQGGIRTSNILPQTLPNGFFYGYYQIIEENLSYTYATVSPAIDSTLAKNRHFFMDYNYFLNNYSSIDSLYYDQLAANINKQDMQSIPPASIFVFVAKPPYNNIQSGILNDPSGTMNALRQWINEYKQMEDRRVRVYNNYENSVIYEIVNREDEVRIDDILDHTYPDSTKKIN